MTLLRHERKLAGRKGRSTGGTSMGERSTGSRSGWLVLWREVFRHPLPPQAITKCACGLDPWFLPVIMLLLDRSQPARRAHGDDGSASQGREMQSRQKFPRRILRRQLIPDGAGPDASAAFLRPMPGLGLRGGECMAAAGNASQAGR